MRREAGLRRARQLDAMSAGLREPRAGLRALLRLLKSRAAGPDWKSAGLLSGLLAAKPGSPCSSEACSVA